MEKVEIDKDELEFLLTMAYSYIDDCNIGSTKTDEIAEKYGISIDEIIKRIY